MIRVSDPSRCCGCSACADACPVGCVEMRADREGFAYPSVDASRCVGCGRCESVCPFLREGGGAPVLAAWAARAADDGLRLLSSSGGAFTCLCLPVLRSGGSVFGVVMDEGSRGCSFAVARDEAGLAPMRGSKYLQADPRGAYAAVLRELRAGRQVLFSGTPCQANALRDFLGGDWQGLLVVDCVCHGVPSPRLWAERVADMEERRGRRVESVSFRCKEAGWRRFGIGERLGGDVVFEPLDESAYLRMFLRDVCLRESCYACRAKTRRLADVTVADFWGVEGVAPGMADDLGCSLVIARTPRGADAVRGAAGLELVEVGYGDAVRGNPAEFRSAVRPPERDAFFGDLDRLGYAGVARRYGDVTARERLKAITKRTLDRMGVLDLVRKMRGGGSYHVTALKYGVLWRFRKADEDLRCTSGNAVRCTKTQNSERHYRHRQFEESSRFF